MGLGDSWVLRLEGILPTGACLSFGALFFTLFAYALFGPPLAATGQPQAEAPCADMKRSSSSRMCCALASARASIALISSSSKAAAWASE